MSRTHQAPSQLAVGTVEGGSREDPQVEGPPRSTCQAKGRRPAGSRGSLSPGPAPAPILPVRPRAVKGNSFKVGSQHKEAQPLGVPWSPPGAVGAGPGLPISPTATWSLVPAPSSPVPAQGLPPCAGSGSPARLRSSGPASWTLGLSGAPGLWLLPPLPAPFSLRAREMGLTRPGQEPAAFESQMSSRKKTPGLRTQEDVRDVAGRRAEVDVEGGSKNPEARA